MTFNIWYLVCHVMVRSHPKVFSNFMLTILQITLIGLPIFIFFKTNPNSNYQGKAWQGCARYPTLRAIIITLSLLLLSLSRSLGTMLVKHLFRFQIQSSLLGPPPVKLTNRRSWYDHRGPLRLYLKPNLTWSNLTSPSQDLSWPWSPNYNTPL